MENAETISQLKKTVALIGRWWNHWVSKKILWPKFISTSELQRQNKKN